MENYLAALIIALIFFGLNKLLKKLFPISNLEYKSDKPLEELRRKYSKFDLKLMGTFFLSAIGCATILYILFKLLIDFKLSSVSDALIIVKPYSIMILLMSMFGGMLSAIYINLALMKRKLASDWDEYFAYSNSKYKYNYAKVGRYTTQIFALITLVLCSLFLDWYSVFGEKEIKLNGLLSLGTRSYKYSDIVKIKEIEKIKAPNGNIIDEPHFIIEFCDGKNWNSRENGFGKYKEDKGIIELVCNKTKLEPIELEFDRE